MEPTFQISTNITFNHVVQNIEHFTFPPFRKKIASFPVLEPYTGVWALEGNKMIGIVLAETNNQGASELFSFLVLPGYRNKGIGDRLLSILQETLKKQGVKTLQSRYWNDWGSVEVIEKMLNSHGWEPPKLLRVITHTNIPIFKAINWPRLILPSGYETFGWQSLTGDDHLYLEDLLRKGLIPLAFNPLQHEDRIFLPVSLGLRHNGKIVGWNITYSFNENTLEYNNLYFMPENRNRGFAILLLHDSLKIQYDLKIPKLVYLINEENIQAKKVIGKLTSGQIEKTIEVRVSRKFL